MKFYLSSSKQLCWLFSLLYLAMIIAVQLSNLWGLYKLFIILLLIIHGVFTIKKYALGIMPNSPSRICCRDGTWYLANRAGVCFSGKLDNCVYFSRWLVILSIVCAKNKKFIFVLITSDLLSPLQFRRLSMKARN